MEETKILEKERGRGIKFESSRKNPRVTEKDKTEHDEALEQFRLDFSKDNQELEEWGKNKEPWDNQYPGIRKFEYTQRMWWYWEYAEEIRERFLSEDATQKENAENDCAPPKQKAKPKEKSAPATEKNEGGSKYDSLLKAYFQTITEGVHNGTIKDSGGRQKLDRGISYERVLQWS